jgi:GNAT superfamily N-acetyltransferase
MSGKSETGNFEWDPLFAMGEESATIAQRVWPRYLSEESDLPQSSLTFEIDEAEFYRRYPAWGLRSKADRRLVAYTNAVLLAIDLSHSNLPEEGWQFAIEAGGRDVKPNCLCLVVANVDPTMQNLRISPLLLEKAKTEARAMGLSHVIAPVRPSHFHEHAELSFESYVNLRRADGELTDPWLRAHERAGGKKLNICHRSATVTATIAKWAQWTSQTYPNSGSYSLERGLAPLIVDLEKNIGTYIEPNVWFMYQLSI